MKKNYAISGSYFQTSDGKPFIPIGINLCFSRFLTEEKEVLEYYRECIANFASFGGNFIRIWIGTPFFEIEHEKEGLFDPNKIERIKKTLAIAEEFGVKVKLTIDHFRTIKKGAFSEIFPGAASFEKEIYSKKNGGSFNDMDDFFSGDASERVFLKKLDCLAKHFKDSPTIMAWELWNEINAVHAELNSWTTWTEKMLIELHRRFPKHLALQSVGSFDSICQHRFYDWLCSLKNNDYCQVHRYLDPGAQIDVCRGAMDMVCADAIRELRKKNASAPLILSEGGAVEWRHSRPSHLYWLDTEGMILHDVLFAPFFAGSAGCGQCWHWEMYIKQQNLWWHFGRFAKAVEGADPISEQYQPYTRESNRLRIYGLKGKNHSLLWCRDKLNDWETELEKGQAPELLKNIKLDIRDIAKDQVSEVEYYAPWQDAGGQIKIDDTTLLLPDFERSIVLKLKK